MTKTNSYLHFPSDLDRSGVPAHFGVGPAAAIVPADRRFERLRSQIRNGVGFGDFHA